jgi:preprotein translocase subunit Sec63
MAEITTLVADALKVLGLDLPVSQAQLEIKRKELLHTWDPSRYANLTNNPKKYMQSFKEAEEMTKKIESAYALLSSWLASSSDNPPSGQIIV